MIGHRNPLIGTAGEGLFKYLAAYHWGAVVTDHDTQAFDAVISWPQYPGLGKLFVQIKTREHLRGRFSRYLRPSEIAGWAVARPIVVLCELCTARAWWMDTRASRGLERCGRGVTIRFSPTNSVDASSAPVVRQLAYRWNNRSMLAATTGGTIWRRKHAFGDLHGLVREVDQEIKRASVLDKDIAALARSRAMHRGAARLSAADKAAILPVLLAQATSTDPGGRSHSLGAAVSLVTAPGEIWRESLQIQKDLQLAAELVAKGSGYAHPEFALLLAARAAEIGSGSVELVVDLLRRFRGGGANPWIGEFMRRMEMWSPRGKPISQLFGRRFMHNVLFRPSDRALAILERQNEAESLVRRMLTQGFDGITAHDLRLVDELTRLRADRFLWNIIGSAG